MTPHYHSTRGLYDFQSKAVSKLVEMPASLVIFSTGTGKTHLAMATSGLLFADKSIDLVIVVAEQNKIADWAEEDYPAFTDLTVKAYKGPPSRRVKILADPPQVLVMTYETARNDICVFKSKSRSIIRAGMLTQFLSDKNVLIVYDEVTKLRGRSSKLHISHSYLINKVLRTRVEHSVRVMGLTANSIEKNPEDHYNIGRVLAPELAGTVEEFGKNYIKSYDFFGNPVQFKNLSAATTDDPAVTPLTEKFGSIVLRKRKSDPDVMAQFPKMIEERPTLVELGDAHQHFLAAVAEVYHSDDPFKERSLFGLLRQIGCHPLSLTRSRGKTAQEIVAEVGEAGLAELGSAKTEEMLAWASRLGEDSGIIFTFYGQSVLPILHEQLYSAGYKVSINHGQMSSSARQGSQKTFKEGHTQIFLSSDAGARGLNLGVGSALLHYEPPLTYAIFDQRSNRLHRIDSVHESVTVNTLVGIGTPDEGAMNLVLRRNSWSDEVLDHDAEEDELSVAGALTANDRRRMLTSAKHANR